MGVLVCPACGCTKGFTVEHFAHCKGRPLHVEMPLHEFIGRQAEAAGNVVVVDADKENAALRAEVARLHAALMRYGHHDDGDHGTQECRNYRDGPETCDCGLGAALGKG